MMPMLQCHEVWPQAHIVTDIHTNAMNARYHNEMTFETPCDGDVDCSGFTGQMVLHFCRRTKNGRLVGIKSGWLHIPRFKAGAFPGRLPLTVGESMREAPCGLFKILPTN